MKKHVKLLLLSLVMVFMFILTGCGNQEYSLVVNSDDSSKLTIRYVVDRDTYDLLSSYDIDRGYNFEQSEKSTNSIERCDVLFQETAAVFHEYGFEITDVNDSISLGFEATKNYTTIEELNNDIKKLYDDGLTKFNGEVTITEGLLSKVYLFSGTVQYYLDPDAESENKNEILEIYDASGLNATVSLRMPGELVAHDGVIEDQLAKYTAKYVDGEEVPVHLKTQITNTLIKNILIGAVVIILIVGSVFVSKNMKKKKEQQKMRELYGDEDEDDSEY